MSCLRSASDLARDVAVGRRPVNNSESALGCFFPSSFLMQIC